MSCEPNQTSRDYKVTLKNGLVKLELLNECIQASIDEKLKELVTKEGPNYNLEPIDNKTFDTMNENTLSIYTNNLYYIIFKVSIFIILIAFYFILSK
jgi:hypothetical protein